MLRVGKHYVTTAVLWCDRYCSQEQWSVKWTLHTGTPFKLIPSDYHACVHVSVLN